MQNTFLIITSIADQNHPILKKFAKESLEHNIPFIVMGDTKSPKEFHMTGCDFYGIERQKSLPFDLAKILPVKHYARKNLGYLIAMSKGAEIIIETDDDNIPLPDFWNCRTKQVNAHLLKNEGWVNVYKYFTEGAIWPRGFALENLQDKLPEINNPFSVECLIQQGLVDENPDVDAIYRLAFPLPITFNKSANIALGKNTICPFNSQNTTWFRETFPLLYLPSTCSFRMTDIWRSFIAQRIAWTCGWSVLFHQSTVRQERNDHNLMDDFRDEISGYNHNAKIYKSLKELNLEEGLNNIPCNMLKCYQTLIDLNLIDPTEMELLKWWLKDLAKFQSGTIRLM